MRASSKAALALAACLLAPRAHAQPAAIAQVYQLAQGEDGAPRPVFLDLVVNGVRNDAVLAELSADDVWVAAEDLARAGLNDFRGARRTSGRRELVSLRSLAPDLSFGLDDVALALELTASASLLRREVVDLAPNQRPPDARHADVASGFLNGAARLDTSGAASGAAEAGVSLGRGDLLFTGISVDQDGRVVRGLTTLTVDRPERVLRFDLGDAVAPAWGLGGGAVVLGAGVARDFSLDPYLVRSPLPTMTGFAATASTAEVWVNGQLVRRQPLAPGTYDFTNLPVLSGANDVRVVVRDAFGRATEMEAAPYVGAGLLRPAMHDFSVHAGFRRERLGVASADYGDFLLVARERMGFTDRVTAGARLEAGPGLASGGASLSFAAPVGQFEAEIAASGGDGRSGAAVFGGWRLEHRRLVTGAFARWQSPSYAHAALAPDDDRVLLRAGITATALLDRVTLAGELGQLTNRDAPSETRLDLRATYRFARGHSFSVSSSTSFGPDRSPAWGLFTSVTFGAGGQRGSAVMSAGVRSDGTGTAAVGLQRSPPIGPGYGYSLNAAGGPRSGSASGRIVGQSEFARGEASLYQTGPESAGEFAVAAGVVALREGLFFTRPVEQGFALVLVPEIAGVTAYRDNQPVGRTNRDGELLVPSLVPFQANRLSIDDGAIPLDRSVGAREQILIAPRRSGALASFAVERLRAVTGRLRLLGAGATAVPAGGVLRLGAGERVLSSPIGEDGAFWLEEVPAGSHTAEIFWRGRLCRFSISVPEEGPAVRDVGELGCGDGPMGEAGSRPAEPLLARGRGRPQAGQAACGDHAPPQPDPLPPASPRGEGGEG